MRKTHYGTGRGKEFFNGADARNFFGTYHSKMKSEAAVADVGDWKADKFSRSISEKEKPKSLPHKRFRLLINCTFSKIAQVPKMLIFAKAVIWQSQLFAFFVFRTFFPAYIWKNSPHRHDVKIGSEIVCTELAYSLFNDNKLVFIYKEFDLY